MTAPAVRLPPGYRLVAFDTVASTNDDARRLLRDGAPAPVVVWAREQAGGRGRDGRSWSSPAGNVYATLMLRPPGAPLVVAQLGFVAALAIAEALDSVVAEVAIKWPNDVLVAGHKIAGILLETEGVAAEGVDGLMIGCGINVAHHPADTRLPATSLHAAGAPGATVEATLEAMLARFERWHAIWRAQGFVPVREAWRARAHGLGGPIQVRLPRETLDGVFRDIDARGALMLETAAGTRAITAGDVFFPQAVC
jgi:BirA family transcriptional regulator, biotin operon repressor / biotin---[acetyl-CoA-carboxylase] ligase